MCSLFRWEGAVKKLLRWRGATSSDLMQLGLIDGQHVAVREREERAKKSRTDRKKANREIKTQQTLAPAVFSCCAAVPRCDKLWFDDSISARHKQTRARLCRLLSAVVSQLCPQQASMKSTTSADCSLCCCRRAKKLIQSSNVATHAVDECRASHLTARD